MARNNSLIAGLLVLALSLVLTSCQTPPSAPMNEPRTTYLPDTPQIPAQGYVELVRRAIENHPALLARQAAMEAAQANLGVLTRPDDPELRANYSSTRSPGSGLNPDERSEEAEWGIRFFTPNPWTGWAARDAAKADIRIAEARLQQTRHELASTLEKARLDYIYAARRARLLDLVRAQAEADYQRALEQAQLNLITATEQAKAASDFLNADLACNRIRQTQQQLEAQLASALQVDVHQLAEYPELSNWPGLPDALPETIFLQEQTLNHRPSLLIRKEELANLQARWNRERKNKLPWPSFLELSYAIEQESPADETWSAQAALSFPLFSWILPDQSDVLKAEVAQQESLLAAERMNAEEQVREASSAYRAARKVLEQFTAASQPIIEQLNQAAADAKTKAEPASCSELTERLLQLQLTSLELHHAVQSAWHELACAVGGNLPPPAR